MTMSNVNMKTKRDDPANASCPVPSMLKVIWSGLGVYVSLSKTTVIALDI